MPFSIVSDRIGEELDCVVINNRISELNLTLKNVMSTKPNTSSMQNTTTTYKKGAARQKKMSIPRRDAELSITVVQESGFSRTCNNQAYFVSPYPRCHTHKKMPNGVDVNLMQCHKC
jgi:hypothetical protein